MEACQCKLNEQERLTDLLTAQKHITSVYNTDCCEAATSAVRSTLMSILQDEHRIQEAVFQEMNTRGYYPLEKAEETKINAQRQKFAGTVSK